VLEESKEQKEEFTLLNNMDSVGKEKKPRNYSPLRDKNRKMKSNATL
jgi:hypothetical protein